MPRFTVVAFVVGTVGLFVPAIARAHFFLQAPASWANQSQQLGDPQKSAPCGQADPGNPAVPTNMVTAVAQGGTITVRINETLFHPGHYRVALSTTGQGGLPPDPAVTPTTQDECASTVVQDPPVYPVLADGMLRHTTTFSGPQMFTVTLPANVTCTSNCVLQVIQYMSSHGAPCFYHHCANITITPGGGTAGTGGGAAGTTGASGTSGGAAGTTGTSGSGGATAGTAGTTGAGGGAGSGVDAGDGGGADPGCRCEVGGTRLPFAGVLLMFAVALALRPARRLNRRPGTRTGS
jgi:hypothetical protein